MNQKIFTVLGATGHVGHIITEELLKRGHAVNAVGRDEKKLNQLLIKGASPCNLELTDKESLTAVCQGSFAVFTMLPPAMKEDDYVAYQDQVGNTIVEALKESEVKRVVNLSSFGADLSEGTGLIKCLHDQEERLNSLADLNFLIHLRPHYFMENLYYVLPMLSSGVIQGCMASDLPIPMVATRDIGWKAADFLDSTFPELHLSFDFVGPREVTFNEVAEIFARACDIPELNYAQISYEEEKKMLMDHGGMNESTADLMIEMEKAFNEGLIQSPLPLKRSHIGTTPLETFVEMIAHTSLAKAA